MKSLSSGSEQTAKTLYDARLLFLFLSFFIVVNNRLDSAASIATHGTNTFLLLLFSTGRFEEVSSCETTAVTSLHYVRTRRRIRRLVCIVCLGGWHWAVGGTCGRWRRRRKFSPFFVSIVWRQNGWSRASVYVVLEFDLTGDRQNRCARPELSTHGAHFFLRRRRREWVTGAMAILTFLGSWKRERQQADFERSLYIAAGCDRCSLSDGCLSLFSFYWRRGPLMARQGGQSMPFDIKMSDRRQERELATAANLFPKVFPSACRWQICIKNLLASGNWLFIAAWRPAFWTFILQQSRWRGGEREREKEEK